MAIIHDLKDESAEPLQMQLCTLEDGEAGEDFRQMSAAPRPRRSILQTTAVIVASLMAVALVVGSTTSTSAALSTSSSESLLTHSHRQLFNFPKLQFPQLLPDPVINAVKVTSGTTTTLTVCAPTTMKSPLPFPIPLHKDLVFDVIYKGINVGNGRIPDFSLKAGSFDVDVTVKMSPATPEQKTAVNEVLARHANRLPSNITMANLHTDPPSFILDGLLKLLKLNSVLPPIDSYLIRKISMNVSFAKVPKVPTSVDMYNPFDVPITITHLDSNVSAKGTPIGSIAQDTSIVLAPTKVTTSPSMEATAILGPDSINLIAQLATGKLNVTVTSSMNLNIQEFPASMDYPQDNVPVAVKVG